MGLSTTRSIAARAGQNKGAQSPRGLKTLNEKVDAARYALDLNLLRKWTGMDAELLYKNVQKEKSTMGKREGGGLHVIIVSRV